MEPHLRYYRACVGVWSGHSEAHVTSFSELRAAVGLSNAFSIWSLALVSGWIGGLRLHTSVRFESDTQVVHTTSLRWFGVPVLGGQETIALHADGCSFELHGLNRVSFIPFRRNQVTGTGEVSSDAKHASYTILFFGAPMQQETTRSDNTVTIEQKLPGYAAIHCLVRVPE